MNARHAYVGNARYAVAQRSKRDDRFFRNTQVARSSRDDCNGALPHGGWLSARQVRGPRNLVDFDVRQNAREVIRSIRCDPRHEQRVAARRDARSDLGDLLRGLARAVYDFGESLPEPAVMIDRRERKRFRRLERQRAQRLRNLDGPVRDPTEQVANVLASHTSAVSSTSSSASE